MDFLPFNNPQNEFFGILSLRGNLRQTKLETHRKNKKTLHLRISMLWLRNHLHMAGNHTCPSLIIDYWLGISFFSPSHRLSWVLETPERQKHTLLTSGFHLSLTMLPFVFPFPNF
jgi:hypothetical protein